jgi:hypothetical protein
MHINISKESLAATSSKSRFFDTNKFELKFNRNINKILAGFYIVFISIIISSSAVFELILKI